jgi:hypothetical protein
MAYLQWGHSPPEKMLRQPPCLFFLTPRLRREAFSCPLGLACTTLDTGVYSRHRDSAETLPPNISSSKSILDLPDHNAGRPAKKTGLEARSRVQPSKVLPSQQLTAAGPRLAGRSSLLLGAFADGPRRAPRLGCDRTWRAPRLGCGGTWRAPHLCLWTRRTPGRGCCRTWCTPRWGCDRTWRTPRLCRCRTWCASRLSCCRTRHTPRGRRCMRSDQRTSSAARRICAASSGSSGSRRGRSMVRSRRSGCGYSPTAKHSGPRGRGDRWFTVVHRRP